MSKLTTQVLDAALIANTIRQTLQAEDEVKAP